jgi:glycosyltransferase involved in cell wall biosynthesis
MQPQPIRRVLVDVSTIVRWTGPPVGIVRVEHELATRAQSSREGSVLCFWDGNAGQFRTLNPRWASLILSWRGTIDPHQPAAGQRRIRTLFSFRRPIVMALERLRLTTRSPRCARLADRLQRAVLALRRHSFPLEDQRGRRLACVARDWALGEALSLTQADVVLLAGTDWYHTDPAAIGALKQRLGFGLAVICYDLIPFLFPALFPAADLAIVRRYWSEVLPIADLIICNSRVVEADVRAVAAAQGMPIRATAVAPLGFELPPAGAEPAALPGGLAPGRYALFVSTIEPRKGHALLLDVWRCLLTRGIPQRLGFHMVFVGRPGWHVPNWDLDAVLQRIDATSGDGMLLHLQGISDAELDALYRNAAFCVYPSLYEGFGLPIIEAFARGKAVIASTGGAVPETAGDLAPCLDPTDAGAWEQLLADWMQHSEHPAAYETRIRAGFAHANWADAVTNILTIAGNLCRCAGEVEVHSTDGEDDRAAP